MSVCLSVCKDVCRNPGGIIKLQERLLNEGSGQNMKIIQAFKYGCKRSKIFGNIQVSMALFLSSYIHQGDYLFSVQSRGKQCASYEFICAFNCPKYTTDRLVKTTFINNDGFVVLEPGVEFLSVFQVVYEHVFLITRYVILSSTQVIYHM